MKSIRGLVVVVASLTLVGGCSMGSQDEGAGPQTVTVTSSSSSTSAQETHTDTSTSSVSSSTPDITTTSPAAGDLPTGVGPYADGFVQAWGIGDRTGASSYATATAVSSLFAYDGRGGSSWTRGSSTVQGSRTQVAYTDGEGQTLYVVVDTAAAQQGSSDAVVGANVEWEDDQSHEGYDEIIPEPGDTGVDPPVAGLPSTVTDYADAFVRAWGVDAVSMDDYASDEVVSTLYTDYGSGGSNWSRSSSTPSTVTYRNSDGSTLVLSLDATTVSAGEGEGIVDASIS